MDDHGQLRAFNLLGRLVIVAGLLLLCAARVEAASGATSIGLEVAPARIDLAIKPSDTSLERDVRITNRGSVVGTFTISAADLVIVDGVPEPLPAGATPYSLAAITTISPSTLTLDPGKAATVKVRFDVSSRRPVLGALLVTPAGSPGTSAAPDGQVGMIAVPQVLIVMSAAPVDATGELLPEIHLAAEPSGLHLPMLQGSGPIIVTATARNTGNVYQRQLVRFEFLAEGHSFLTVAGLTASAMPGGEASASTSTLQHLESDGGLIDVAPIACICEVRAYIRASIAGRATAPVVEDGYVIVFPYRAALVILAVLVALLLVYRWRQHRKRTDYQQSRLGRSAPPGAS